MCAGQRAPNELPDPRFGTITGITLEIAAGEIMF
jgi:hypothetical protein